MNIKSKVSISFFFFLMALVSFSQDEMKLRDLIKTSTDTTLIKAYIDLGNYYYSRTHKGDSLIKYSEKALKLSQSIKNVKKEMTSYSSLAIAYNANAINYERTEDYINVILNLKKGLELAKRVDDKKMQANFYNKFGIIYLNQGNRALAMENRLNAARISESISDFTNAAVAYGGISLIFAHDGQVDKQLEYINKTIEIVENKEGISDKYKQNIYANASQEYLQLFEELKNENYGYLSVKYANKALELAISNNFTARIPSVLNSLSHYYLLKNDFNKSLYYAQETLKYNEYMSESTKLNVFLDLANLYKKTNQKKLAYVYLDSINKLEIKKEPYYGYDISKNSFEIYKQFKDFNLAFIALDELNEFDLKLKEENQDKKINELETKYQTELKDAEIVSLNQQKMIDDLTIKNKQAQIIWLLTIAVITILSIMFFFRQRSLKNKQKILETEQRLNRARINPHFFFNGMASLQNLSLQEKSPKTTLFISRFAKIMRQSLESTYEELTTVEEEIDFLTQYLEIQKLRYPEKFDFQFHIEESLEINELKLPGMLMQPFVENAIEHGFKDIEYKGKIDIAFKEEKNKLLITVDDNGKGFKEADKEKEHKSRAMQIIKDRLYLFNKQYHSNAFYEMANSEKSKGFKIIVTLPKLYI
jgi:two-component sensor histidine kinase/tetratricopeptide (TPR) repeat protein